MLVNLHRRFVGFVPKIDPLRPTASATAEPTGMFTVPLASTHGAAVDGSRSHAHQRRAIGRTARGIGFHASAWYTGGV